MGVVVVVVAVVFQRLPCWIFPLCWRLRRAGWGFFTHRESCEEGNGVNVFLRFLNFLKTATKATVFFSVYSLLSFSSWKVYSLFLYMSLYRSRIWRNYKSPIFSSGAKNLDGFSSGVNSKRKQTRGVPEKENKNIFFDSSWNNQGSPMAYSRYLEYAMDRPRILQRARQL